MGMNYPYFRRSQYLPIFLSGGSSRNRAPSWVPTANGAPATVYADFTTEGSTNHYWYNNSQYAGEALWLAALGGTFTGANGTYVNSAGLITQATANTARFDYDPVTLLPKGILLEGARTNLSLWSDDLNNAQWGKQNCGEAPSPVANRTGGVYGRVTANAGAAFHYVNQGYTFTAAAYTFSFDVRRVNNDWIFFTIDDTKVSYFNLATGLFGTMAAGVTATATVLPAGAYRISATLTETAGSRSGGGVGIANADNGGSFNASGTEAIDVSLAQMEPGAFASSYIPTTSASVTRAADSLTLPSTLFRAAPGTILAAVYQATSPPSRVMGTNSASSHDIFEISTDTLAQQFQGYSGGASATFGSGSFSGGVAKLGFAWDGAGGQRLVANAGTVVNPSGVTYPNSAYSLVNLAGDANGNAFQHFQQLAVIGTYASNAELQRLTT